MLVGELPKPAELRDKLSQSPGAMRLLSGLSLSLLGLIFPLVRHAEQMIKVRLDRHSLPHIRLSLAVFRIEGFFLSRQFLAGLFISAIFGSFAPSKAHS